MNNLELKLQVRAVAHDVAIIDIAGDLTGQGEEALMEAYHKADTGSVRTIVLNLNDLDYMNSSGIGLLVTLLIRAQRNQRTLCAYGLSDHYQQIFALTRLNEAIGIFATETEALKLSPVAR